MIGTLAPMISLVGLAVFLLVRNWAGWTDPVIDFGRELYIPWRLVEGQVLYRDIAYLDGPLSPYWNALSFTLFPVAMRTLEMANIAVIAGVSALIFALLQRLIGSEGPHPLDRRIVASAGVALFLCAFAVNLLGTGGNMNWVAPYSHGITHGVALSLLSIWWFARHLERGRVVDLALAGLALGLSALTKPEIFAAAGSAIGVGMLVSLRSPPTGAGPPLWRLAVLFGCTAVPCIGAVGLLMLAMPFPDALSGALGGWSHLLSSEVRTLDFYRWVMGIDAPVENLEKMALTAGIWATVLVPAFIGAFSEADRRLRNRVAIAFSVAVVASAPWTTDWFIWRDVFRPMVFFLAAFTAMAATRAWRLASDAAAPRAILELSVSVLALGLMGKILLKPWLAGYAFALLVPGVLLLVFALLHAAPAAIQRRGGDGRLFGRVALALLTLVSLACLLESEQNRSAKTVQVGTGGDYFVADEQRRPHMIENLTDWVENRLPPDATLLVLPEGVMVNYLTRRINPTRHLNFMPPELAIFDEQQILADLQTHPPDFVALIHRDSSEYKLALFGTDYGESLLAWVRARYVVVLRVGPEPLRPAWERADGLRGWEVRQYRGAPGRGRTGS